MPLSPLIPTRFPLIQAPMAGAQGSALALAVCQAGGLLAQDLQFGLQGL
ncbi:MAG: hypothetical protein ACKOBF_06890 [Limnohabitans sp.]